MSVVAFFLIIWSAIIHAIWNFSTKKTSGNFYCVYIWVLIASIVFAPILLFYPVAEIFKEAAFWYILASGVIHAAYFFLLAKAYEHGDISATYPIARWLGIAGTSIIAYTVLHEHITALGAVWIVIIILGIIAIGFKRKHNENNYKGLLFALLVWTMTIAYSITDKVGVWTISPLLYIYGFTLVTAICLTPYAILKKHNLLNARAKYKKQSFIIGLWYFIAYGTILYALTLTQVSYVVALRELAVAIGATLGFVLLREKCTWKKVVGIILIVLGMVIIKIA